MKRTARILLLLASAGIVAACEAFGVAPERPDSGRRYSDVAIIYSIGYNNLKGDIANNLRTVYNNPLPMLSSDKVLLHFEHQSLTGSDWETPTSPLLIRISSDWNGKAVLDTLLTLEPGTFSTDGHVMEEVFNYIHDKFPSDRYGVLFSSHGTGWLPEQYYDNSEKIEREYKSGKRSSFGCEARKENGATVSHEMDIRTMATSLPYKLDYIIFDACLMGCVEVAYELKGCTDVIGFSQTEVLSGGFCYETFTRRMLTGERPDPLGYCQDYFNKYDKASGSRYATISLIDCRGLDNLSDVCATLFERYRTGIAAANKNEIQRFCRRESSKWWLFDLEDILVHAGISAEDHAKLKDALDKCVVYTAHTDKFFEELTLRTDCGFSMFLPSSGSEYLRSYYRGLAWNKATTLVE